MHMYGGWGELVKIVVEWESAAVGAVCGLVWMWWAPERAW